jgi:NAD(P)H dehydrogenase (quinone)
VLALLVTANPNRASLTHAMADAARRELAGRKHDVAFHDLYAEGFEPVRRSGEAEDTRSGDHLVEQHCTELAAADLILVFHPNWWGQPPAILKGWLDRVFRLDTAYTYPPGVSFEGIPQGLLRARHAFVFNTSNTPADRELAAFGDPLDTLWRKCVFGLCGVDAVTRRMYSPVAGSTEQQRAAWIAEVASLVGSAA